MSSDNFSPLQEVVERHGVHRLLIDRCKSEMQRRGWSESQLADAANLSKRSVVRAFEDPNSVDVHDLSALTHALDIASYDPEVLQIKKRATTAPSS